jgi:hypothetical protein
MGAVLSRHEEDEECKTKFTGKLEGKVAWKTLV